jgi:NAD(P)-dependent dehydrogenase (short-subunit alcohol dehydrogenase family)
MLGADPKTRQVVVMAPVQGLRVVVTGGLGVLGRAVGQQLQAQGAAVVLMDKADGAAPAGVAALIGGVDLADGDTTTHAMRQAAGRLGGGLDALVNIAGGFTWETLEGGTLDTWDRMYTMNLRTAVAASRAALPWLKASPRGSIVNVSALGSVKAAAGMGAYAASKSGVARLTEALAEEHKATGLRVNAVLPSILDTAANRASMPDADTSRWVQPAQLAAVIGFLISDDAAAVTGALIPVAGRV